MATQALAYGIDFGTSNSAIAVAYPDRVELVELGPQAALTLPSFVYLNRGGSQGAGEEAARLFLESGHQRTGCNECSLAPYGADTECRQYRRGGGCNDARLLAGVKHDLARIGFAGTNSWATDFSVADLVAVVIRRLKTEADASTETDVRRLVLGHPVVFSGTDQAAPGASRAEALRRLGEA
ncbi:MAG TPA: hypothetical protein VG015_01885, partial [Candidatus Dormibacteraeota bacterium]|nr:hypothetical protein [Candidatus Dormibacteraeota bacterium]